MISGSGSLAKIGAEPWSFAAATATRAGRRSTPVLFKSAMVRGGEYLASPTISNSGAPVFNQSGLADLLGADQRERRPDAGGHGYPDLAGQ